MWRIQTKEHAIDMVTSNKIHNKEHNIDMLTSNCSRKIISKITICMRDYFWLILQNCRYIE